MAIYYLNHSSIGKSTHAARTAGAHIRYITRPNAQAELLGNYIPVDRLQARRFFDFQEKVMRKNGRVADKIIVALPLELHPLQRAKLVREFCETLTKNNAPWFVAIHQQGKDSGNPHAHIVIHDRSLKTGKKVVQLSKRNSTLRLRKLWGEKINVALKKQGYQIELEHRRARQVAQKAQITKKTKCALIQTSFGYDLRCK